MIKKILNFQAGLWDWTRRRTSPIRSAMSTSDVSWLPGETRWSWTTARVQRIAPSSGITWRDTLRTLPRFSTVRKTVFFSWHRLCLPPPFLFKNTCKGYVNLHNGERGQQSATWPEYITILICLILLGAVDYYSSRRFWILKHVFHNLKESV